MSSEECRVANLLRIACQVLEDMEKELLEENRVEDRAMVLLADMFCPEIQHKLKEVSEFLVECGVEDVGIGAIVSKLTIVMVQKVKDDQKRAELNVLLKKFDKYVSLLHEIEFQFKADIRNCSYQLSKIKEDSILNDVEPFSDVKLPLSSCIPSNSDLLLKHEKYLELLNDLDVAMKKEQMLQEQVDAYCGLPPDLKKAEEELEALKSELKKNLSEFQKLSNSNGPE